MNPRIFSTLILRLFAVWLLMEGLLSAVDVILIHNQLMNGLPGVHMRLYNGFPHGMIGDTDMYLHDTYYVFAHANPALIPTALRFAGCLILWFSSKPVARFLTRDLESPDPERRDRQVSRVDPDYG